MEERKKQSTGIQLILLSGLKFWNQGVSLIKTMIISRMFSLTEYGIYTKILLILDFAFAIIVLNLPSCATYFISKSKSKKEKESFIFTYYVLCTIVGILMGILLYCISPFLSVSLNCPELVKYRWFLLVTSLTQIISKATTYVLTSQGESQKAVKISFSSSILLLISLFIANYSTNSFDICLLLMIIVEIIQTIIGYIVAYKNIDEYQNLTIRNSMFNIKYVRKIYNYIIPVGLSSIILIINTRIDKILVSITASSEFYAIYANASKELPVAALSVAISSVIIPKIVEILKNNDKESAIKIWRHSFLFVFILSSLLLVGTEVFAKEVMTIIYSDKYAIGVNIFRIYLLLIPFHCIAFSILLSAMGQTKYIFKSAMLSMIVNVTLDILLMNLIGYMGLGIATIIATAFMTYLQLLYSAKLLDVSIKNLIPIPETLGTIGINILFMITFYFFKRITLFEGMMNEISFAVLLGFVWSILYLLLQRKKLIKEWHGLNYKD